MRKGPIILPGILGFITICVLCLLFHVKRIEHDLARRSTLALEAKNIPAGILSFSGRDATLTGSLDNAEAIDMAANLVSRVYGVRVVNNRLTVAKAPELFLPTLKVTTQANFITLVGLLPDTVSKDSLIDMVAAAYGKDNIIDQVKFSKNIASAAWLPSLRGVFPLIGKDLENGGFYIEGKKLTLTGNVASVETKNEMINRVKAATRSYLQVEDALNVKPERPEIKRLEQDINKLLANEIVYFESNSAIITPRAQEILDQVVQLLKDQKSLDIEIIGHADASGNKKFNLVLSQRRAEAVMNYLKMKGLDSIQFTTIGHASSKPVADNTTAAGRAQNRRVEFKIKERE